MTTPPKIVIYGSETCGYCTAVRLLLKRKGANYEDILVSKSAIHRQEMERRSGRRSVPQVFIDDQPVGGFDELSALDKSGQLDQLLGIENGAP